MINSLINKMGRCKCKPVFDFTRV